MCIYIYIDMYTCIYMYTGLLRGDMEAAAQNKWMVRSKRCAHQTSQLSASDPVNGLIQSLLHEVFMWVGGSVLQCVAVCCRVL